jgi:tetratricopeptide (TPR) repeat protein
MNESATTKRPSLFRRFIRYFDPGAEGFLHRMARLVAIFALIGLCLLATGLAMAERTEMGRFATLYALYDWGLYDQAVSLADGLIKDYPHSRWDYYRLKAAALRRSGHYKESLAVYDAAIAASPNWWWAYSHRCFYGALLGDAKQVLDSCDKQFELNPSDAVVAYDRRAIARTMAGDRAGAIADFEKALQLSDQGVPVPYAPGLRALRGSWLATLKAGGNPLTQDVIWQELARYGTPRGGGGGGD